MPETLAQFIQCNAHLVLYCFWRNGQLQRNLFVGKIFKPAQLKYFPAFFREPVNGFLNFQRKFFIVIRVDLFFLEGLIIEQVIPYEIIHVSTFNFFMAEII